MEDAVGRARVERAEERQKQQKESEERDRSSSSGSKVNQEANNESDANGNARMDEVDEEDLANQIDPEKWAKFKNKVRKRAAEQDMNERPAQQPKIKQAQGEKRAAETLPDEAAVPQKSGRVDGGLNRLIGKDWQIGQEIMHLQSPDVVEIYSPPRVTQHAEEHKLKP
eukprot:2628472-Karenia_brevis.AAC.1